MIFAYGSSINLASQIADKIRILIFFVYSVCLGDISSMLFQGLGEGMTSLILTLFRVLIAGVSFAYLFSVILNIGELGVYLGIVIGGIIGGIINVKWANYTIRQLKRKNIINIDKN